MNNSTIAAIATPIGSGGIGIIRISGQKAVSIAASLFQRSRLASNVSSENSIGKHFGSTDRFKSHHFYHGFIVHPETGQVLDEVLLTVMKAPHSYTREDIVEIHTHSGRVVMGAVLTSVLRQGARLADPGEFTKRAFINGRIDLIQAEAVVDIINAKTDEALKMATRLIMGGLGKQVESIRESLVHVLASFEAAIDFPEEAEEIIETDSTREHIQSQAINVLKKLIDQYDTSHVVRDGLKLVVLGRPNVGKSSLMNCLIQKDRAIVTSVPGTTRDFIEEHLSIEGIPVIITDTAGIQETKDPVEAIGVQKAREYMDQADLILFLVDASSSLLKEDKIIYQQLKDKPFILVINKSDLVDKDFNIEFPDSWGDPPRVKVSALYRRGLEALKARILDICVSGKLPDSNNGIVPNLRHKIALERCLRSTLAVAEGGRIGRPLELVVIDLKDAIDSLEGITGATTREDILDEIFHRFCIGK
ncbi:MAG: tRNA uridine-5-carboxymethylaminomethyl(34) synthesis GTPase MnmE [Desulfobacterales bacterium]|jgi:tRNA modification GTPase|nr:tRNA uridine-5-carboxymethylaminomethyl(34) synthesis GTPase MnmE [Desulfobacter sp.]MDP6682568.1 tRNA uridine-5-carboxymethylaminomethyl(34) synthesis GTPase MnmE [Desulfobacterales bacterium]|tara:strand:+ start:37088 stop:38515 length:1428 start_codon:yes stop_codon:yes gene_type:complete